MAKMFTELELMRSAVEGALEAIDAGRSDVDQAVSLAKAIAGDTLKLVSREMVQLHGGIGMTDEHDAGLLPQARARCSRRCGAMRRITASGSRGSTAIESIGCVVTATQRLRSDRSCGVACVSRL